MSFPSESELIFAIEQLRSYTELSNKDNNLVSVAAMLLNASGTTTGTTSGTTTVVSNALTNAQLRSVAVPISAALLPLPIGAATSFNQTTSNSSLATIVTNMPTLGQALAASSTPVVLTAVQIATLTPLSTINTAQSGAWTVTANTGLAQPVTDIQLRATALPISVTSLPLPTNAANIVNQSTIIARLTAIEAKLQGGYRAAATIQRSADVNPYFANDVYGSTFELLNVGAANGFSMLINFGIIFNITTLPVGMGGFALYLYSSEPSTIPDNAAFSIPPADLPKLLTPEGIYLSVAKLAVGGGLVVLDASQINRLVPSTGTSLFGRLVTQGGFTPANASETATISSLFLGA